MDAFHRTHQYLVEHLNIPLRRKLMDQINWEDRLIGIKGTRGVGKTTFLLQYAKENYVPGSKDFLYINLNDFYFTCNSLSHFANEFRMKGGKVLLIDQVFKIDDWSKELRYCYDNYPDLKIVFSGSSVMCLDEGNLELWGKVTAYDLKGFSFREFLYLTVGVELKSYTLDEIIRNHKEIATEICSTIKPLAYLEDYMYHGYYPFFLEKRNFSENLIKTMNLMIEIDISSIMQIERSYLTKLKKLLYILATSAPGRINISQLSSDTDISRATVMNYIHYLQRAELINLLYAGSDDVSKKPDSLYLHNPNLILSIRMHRTEDQALINTFFFNQVRNDCKVNTGRKGAQFLVDKRYNFIVEKGVVSNVNPNLYYANCGIDIGEGNRIPLWLFGFLY